MVGWDRKGVMATNKVNVGKFPKFNPEGSWATFIKRFVRAVAMAKATRGFTVVEEEKVPNFGDEAALLAFLEAIGEREVEYLAQHGFVWKEGTGQKYTVPAELLKTKYSGTGNDEYMALHRILKAAQMDTESEI